MKIVMDFRKYDGVIGGVERMVIEISRYVARQGHTVVLLPKIDRLAEVKKEFGNSPNIKFMPLEVLSHAMSFKNVYMDTITIQNIAKTERADVVHFPYNWSFPFRRSTPCILTIHDVIPFTFREGMGVLRNNLLYRPGMRLASRLNDSIVTVSEFSKQDIAMKVGVPISEIKVIPNGVKPSELNKTVEAELEKKFQLKDGFILYIGGIHERKNVVRLIHSFSELVRTQGFPGKLLVTGSTSGSSYKVKMKRLCDSAVRETGMEERVEFTGFISNEEVSTLIRKAKFLVYPSLYEGFGMPVIEAMQAGTPVIASNITAIPEVAGGAAVLIDPYSTDEIVSEMSKLLCDDKLRRELRKQGRKKAELYSWDKTAQLYLDLYKSLRK